MGLPCLQAQEEEFFDDTTQEVYGPQATLFLTPADIKYNRAGWRPVVISIDKMHRFTYKQQAGNKLQDLGNDGTAAKPIFYVLPKQIGATSGFYVYDLYFQAPYQFKYYDTKSPYTDGSIVLANYGSYVFDVCHSRSFNQHWHLGASFQTMLIDKELIPTKIPGDRQVITYPFALFAHYKTDGARYQVLGSFYRKNHRVREIGGISSNDPSLPMADWLKAKAPIKNNLDPNDKVESSELRHQYHLYHQFAFTDQLQAYHEIVRRNKFNHFKAAKLSDDSKQLLGAPLRHLDSTQDSTVMQTLGNEVGIKGDIDRFFYRYYYRHRKIKLQRQYLAAVKELHEHYLGLQARLNLRDSIDWLHIGGAYLWDDLYKFHTAYQGAMGDLAYEQLRYKPSLLAQRYEGNHRSWRQGKLTPPMARQVRGGMRLVLPGLLLRPHASFTRVEKPIYFRQPQQARGRCTNIAPRQAKKHADIMMLSADVNLTLLAHFHVDNEITLAKVQGPAADVFRMPSFLINTRLYYANTLYEGRLDLETGIAMHWRTSYKADGYDPATQQFYLQDDFLMGIYPVADLFLSFRIKHFRGFMNVTYLNQGLPLPGYFVTPAYPAQFRSLDVGVSWSFFD